MPAETAAAPVVTEAIPNPNANTPAPADETSATPTKATPDRVARILEAEGLAPIKPPGSSTPATTDKTQSHEQEQNSESDASGSDQTREEIRSGDAAGSEDADAGKDGESEEEVASENAANNPFKDPRVQDRLGREARKRERIARAAGLSDDEITQAQSSNDPVVAMEQLLAQRQQAANSARFTGPQAPQGEGLLGKCTTPQQVDQWVAAARAKIAWCRANKDGTTVTDGNGTERFITPEEIAADRELHQQVLVEAPERRQHIREALTTRNEQQQKFDGVARERYASFFDPEQPDFQQLAGIGREDEVIRGFVADHPEVLADPRINLLLARYVSGYKTEGKGKAAAAGANGKTVSKELEPFMGKRPIMAKPVPTVRTGGAGSGRIGRAEVTKARERVQAGGDADAEVDFVSTLRQSQHSNGAALV